MQRCLIIPFFWGFTLFGFSFAIADASTDAGPSLRLDEQAIWRISDLEMNSGTGFFVGLNRFVTNFHVISDMLSGSGSLADIILSQQWRNGSVKVIKIERIIILSALYDLALLETRDWVVNYLPLRESSLDPGEDLFVKALP